MNKIESLAEALEIIRGALDFGAAGDRAFLLGTCWDALTDEQIESVISKLRAMTPLNDRSK